MKNLILVGFLAILALVAGRSASAQNGPPLVPADVKITPPSGDLPEELKKCLGGYSGRVVPLNFRGVGKGVNVTIFVTHIISSKEAKVLLCWGDNPWGEGDNEEGNPEINRVDKGYSFNFLRKDGRRTCELIIYDDGRVSHYWRNASFVMQGDLERMRK